MLGKLKRITATILAIATVVTSIPIINVAAAGNGEKKQAGIVTLGKLGTVNIGSKSESGTWVKTLVDGNDVFCLDLGKACHTDTPTLHPTVQYQVIVLIRKMLWRLK